jgi:hypothetical protein
MSMSELQIIFHNPYTDHGKGMEIYPISQMKEVLDRAKEVLGSFDVFTKGIASKLIDNQINEVMPIMEFSALRSVALTGENLRSVHLYVASLGKAK